MTGHHPWDELMRKHYTPEERERMRQEALRELEDGEHRHGGQVPVAGEDGETAGSEARRPGRGRLANPTRAAAGTRTGERPLRHAPAGRLPTNDESAIATSSSVAGATREAGREVVAVDEREKLTSGSG